MFKHHFQGGECVEVFDAKGRSLYKHIIIQVNPAKERIYNKLYKNYNPRGIKRIFDRETKGKISFVNFDCLKGYIYDINSSLNSKIKFPKSDKKSLGLVQQYLVF